MAEVAGLEKHFSFLQGGGEMGELTRNYDWPKTSIGTPERWPVSLQATVANLLHSAFPTLLFWGPDLICFYNDAVRPSLGVEGRHPSVGKKGEDVWTEIWDFVGPLLKGVMATGDPVRMEDQLVPFYRNGRMDEIYWTFSYNPAFGDEGKINGVLVTCIETTKTVNSIVALRESEDRFQNMMRDIDVGLIVQKGQEMRVALANEAYCRIIGHSIDEIINRPLFDAIPEAADFFLPILQRVLTTGERYVNEAAPYSIHGADGTPLSGYARVVYQPYREADGTISGVLSVVTDVTEQVLARQKVEKSETRFRSLIEEAPVATCLFVGREFRIEVANEAMIQVWGKGHSVRGKRLIEALPELVGQPFIPLMQRLYDTGETYEAKAGRADLVVDGELKIFYFNYIFKPLRDEKGKVYALLETAVDVTEQVKARQALQKSEQNLRNTVLQAPAAICILRGEDAVIEITNGKMAELLGRPADQLEGQSLFAAVPEVADWGLQALLHQVRTTGETFKAIAAPFMLSRPNALEQVYVDFVYEAYREADGSISGVIVVAIDVTDQVVARKAVEESEARYRQLSEQLEQQVQERTKELEQQTEELAASNEELEAAGEELMAANEELGVLNRELQRSNANLEEFAHAASHDLKEPIRKITVFTSRLKNQLTDKLSPGENALLERVEHASLRMGNLIDDLLLYSHVSQRPHAMEAVNLNQKVQNVLEDLELDIQEKRAVITTDPLPVVQGYRRQLQQLFQNLLSNALKYSKAGTAPVIVITANTSEEGGKHYHVINVEDNGIGFAQEYADKIFQMFQRLHGKAEYSGTGVGLSIAKKVVENHEGFIRVQSKPGEGTTFRVYLPFG